MPRRRPGALRAQRYTPPRLFAPTPIQQWWGDGVPVQPLLWPTRIDRLAPRTVSAVHRAECLHAERLGPPDGVTHADRRPFIERLVSPGTTRAALETLRRFLSSPDRYVYVRHGYCPCDGCEATTNAAVAREVLDLMLPVLPHYARRDLESLPAELDGELRRRTLPDPFAHRRSGRRGAWWLARLYHESAHR
ncbi:hypothetical protein ACIHAR_12240 [Streptomyces sp. NPDC052016]|uniref:hypothetical protein n=1 Tax=Streptomyces sp. NPDC052016 TaxID=3365680 RepID=UPI0037D29E1C